ncbi:MAG: hypothetical protein N3E51_04820 [Candidatus Micrarchaeota archaeon]|nr:hypothetical protein [Candidatus Micrarchaeota archaeon]
MAMILVFELPLSDKPKLTAVLEADPYGEKSFSRNGYKIKEGAQVGLASDRLFLYLKCTEEFAKFAKEKLAGLAAEAKAEDAAKVSKAIEEEESNAEIGFGSIFGTE